MKNKLDVKTKGVIMIGRTLLRANLININADALTILGSKGKHKI